MYNLDLSGDYIDVRDITDRVDELREERAPPRHDSRHHWSLT